MITASSTDKSDTMKDNLHLKLQDWLNEQGYPLEMLTARFFRQGGFRVNQSAYYTDTDIDKPREIDVLASHFIHDDIGYDLVALDIEFCIECKMSIKKPWLVFTAAHERSYEFSRPVFSKIGNSYLYKLFRQQQTSIPAMFAIPDRIGYGLTQAFTSGEDIPFKAITSAVKAAVSQAINADKMTEEIHTLCYVGFPIIVIDGLLIDCSLSETSDVILEQVDSAVLDWKYPLPNQNLSVTVNIYTKAAFDKLLRDATEVKNFLVNRFNELTNIAYAEHKARAKQVDDESISISPV